MFLLQPNQKTINPQKMITIVIINLIVGGLHFLTGEKYSGPLPLFVNGYLIDILLPFALYFLICLVDLRIFKHWWARATVPFLIGVKVEVAQYYGLPIFGQTFDPLDLLAYGTGVTLAVLTDKLLLSRFFVFWNQEQNILSEVYQVASQPEDPSIKS